MKCRCALDNVENFWKGKCFHVSACVVLCWSRLFKGDFQQKHTVGLFILKGLMRPTHRTQSGSDWMIGKKYSEIERWRREEIERDEEGRKQRERERERERERGRETERENREREVGGERDKERERGREKENKTDVGNVFLKIVKLCTDSVGPPADIVDKNGDDNDSCFNIANLFVVIMWAENKGTTRNDVEYSTFLHSTRKHATETQTHEPKIIRDRASRKFSLNFFSASRLPLGVMLSSLLLLSRIVPLQHKKSGTLHSAWPRPWQAHLFAERLVGLVFSGNCERSLSAFSVNSLPLPFSPKTGKHWGFQAEGRAAIVSCPLESGHQRLKGYPHQRWNGIRPELSGRIVIFLWQFVCSVRLRCGWALNT